MSSVEAQTIVPAPWADAKGIDMNSNALPEGFPAMIHGDSAWTATNFSNNNEYIYHLSAAEVSEVKQGLDGFKKLGLNATKITDKTFSLPTLGITLHDLSKEVHNGRGFAVLRGLNTEDFSSGDLTMIFMGISAYIGDKIGRQDRAGNCLVHIIADKANGTHHRHSTDPIKFHTEESGDCIAWLTRNVALDGGKCVISSTATIYNVLAATRPDLLRIVAAGNWPFAFPRYQCRPVMFNQGGKVLFNFGRAPLLGSSIHPRKAHLPTLTAQQVEALDAIEAIARATEFSFATQPGDIHFIANQTVLHRRDGFTDGQGQRRHLVRLRLSSSAYGAKIPALSREWNDAFGEVGDRVFHFDPMPSQFFPLRKYPN
ncbi:Clavaminate synthase-like protein [Cryphonectria parasitica EP155]|uniref:Clavaminate synthase-like protein n=1 Tax=Cryphonectria parasitica (strain ATCC 38755 / EP155) TaxID=660469 RepID=A0A9P4YA89_CRYP1|nr:Clavaminate synthase-like protein [Cryphonectria parasitica EP155]KAF3768915.1 Clavaminate synthase-like protein [Cryphonectria parasitica EP155]